MKKTAGFESFMKKVMGFQSFDVILCGISMLCNEPRTLDLTYSE